MDSIFLLLDQIQCWSIKHIWREANINMCADFLANLASSLGDLMGVLGVNFVALLCFLVAFGFV